MKYELTFKEHSVAPFDNGDGKIWFAAKQAATLLGYTNAKSIANLYNRNADEFTTSMSLVTHTVTSGKINGLQHKKVRIFSLRGLHLLGMLAETPIAKDVRKWVLDLIEQEASAPQVGGIRHTIEQMQHIVASAQKASDEDASDAGRRLRKRQGDLPELAKAKKLVTELSQIPFELIGGGKREVLAGAPTPDEQGEKSK